MSTWFKFPCDYWTQPRMFKLKRALKTDALWVPARVWSFAALQGGTGDLSQYQPDELAEAIGYTGDAAQLVAALKEAGYVDAAGMVVGWSELYGLAASRKSSAAKAANARWARPPAPPSDPEKTREEERRVRGEAHALRDGMRDASTLTHTQAASLVLSDSDCAAIAADVDVEVDRICECLRVFNDIKANFPGDPRTPDAFRGWLRTAKQAKEILGRREFDRAWGSRRAFSQQQDYRGVKEKNDAPPPPNVRRDSPPDGWHARLNALRPGNVYTTLGSERYTTNWHDLPQEARAIVLSAEQPGEAA